MRNVLITAEEVIFHAPTKHALDPRMIEASIIVAEERFIRPELGFELYNSLVEAKNKEIAAADVPTYVAHIPGIKEGDIVNAFEFLTVEQLKLWKQHLWKLTAECVITACYPEGFVQFGAEGATHNNPPAGLMVTSGFVTPLLTSMKWSIDKKVKDRIAPLIQSMHNFICLNKAHYPGYIKYCEDCGDGKNNQKYTGIALNIYDDDDDERCCEPGWLKK